MTLQSTIRSPIRSPLSGSLGSSNFTPKTITNLCAWYDASDLATITKDGSSLVSAWSDKSGNNNTALQATGTKQPKYLATGINSLPVIYFRHDGTNPSVLQAADSVSMNYTLFDAYIVVKRTLDLGANSQLIGKYTATGNMREWRMYFGTGTPGALGGNTSADGTAVLGSFNSVPAMSTNTTYLCGYGFDGTNRLLSVNGSTSDTDAQASMFNGTATLDIGGREATPAEPFSGYIGEAIFYTKSLSVSERAQLINYLRNKWNF